MEGRGADCNVQGSGPEAHFPENSASHFWARVPLQLANWLNRLRAQCAPRGWAPGLRPARQRFRASAARFIVIFLDTFLLVLYDMFCSGGGRERGARRNSGSDQG